MGDRYTYFQGKSGSRIGVGVLAVIQAACIALFQLLSKVLVLTALLLLRLMVMTAPAIAVVAVLKPEILPALLRVAGAAIVNTIVVGALAGLHALLVVTMFRPGSGIDLWLALLVTGVVTVVLWAVARPFRRLVSMVSLTNEQFGGIVPGAGQRPDVAGVAPGARRVGRRPPVPLVGGAALRGRGRSPGTAPCGPRRSRSWRRRTRRAPDRAPPRRRTEVEPRGTGRASRRRAGRRCRAGRTGSAPRRPSPRWADPGEVDDRVIYRRPDAVPLRPGGARPVAAELVDGMPDLPHLPAEPDPPGVLRRRRVSPGRRVGRAPVPIRTPRGRSAAYRALWQWPLRSPARLGLCVVLVLAVVVGAVAGIGVAARAPPRSARSCPRPGVVGDRAPRGRRGDRQRPASPSVLPPVADLTPSSLPLSAAPSPALSVAARWAAAWVNHPQGMTSQQWVDGLRPFTTDEYLGVLTGVDPANIPASRVTGEPRALRVAARSVQVEVPTNALTLDVLVVATEDGWRVAGYDRV